MVGRGFSDAVLSLLRSRAGVAGVERREGGFRRRPAVADGAGVDRVAPGTGLLGLGGVLVSLRAATVRQAQQTLNIAIMIVLFVPLLGLRALPEAWQARAVAAAWALGSMGLTVAVVTVLALVAAGLLAAAFGRFRRAQLILD